MRSTIHIQSNTIYGQLSVKKVVLISRTFSLNLCVCVCVCVSDVTYILNLFALISIEVLSRSTCVSFIAQSVEVP